MFFARVSFVGVVWGEHVSVDLTIAFRKCSLICIAIAVFSKTFFFSFCQVLFASVNLRIYALCGLLVALISFPCIRSSFAYFSVGMVRGIGLRLGLFFAMLAFPTFPIVLLSVFFLLLFRNALIVALCVWG